MRHKSELLFDLVHLGLPVRGEYTGIAQHNLQVDQVLHEAVLRLQTISIRIIANARIIAISTMMISTMLTMSMTTRVDEAGSEGAAATAIMMSRMLFVPKVVFSDQPFYL